MDEQRLKDLFSNLPDLDTPRLRLRRLTEHDLEDVFAYTSDAEVARYIRRPLHATRAEAHAYLETILHAYASGKVAPWGVEHRASGKIIGTCGFFYWNVADARGEVYYALARPYWRQGYAAEALSAVLAFGFERMDLNRIEGVCWVENTASARVLEKVGMRFEGLLRQYVLVKGDYRDLRWYSILREEYRSQAEP